MKLYSREVGKLKRYKDINMVEFITEGLNRGGNYVGGGRWSSFPLYFNVEYDQENIGTLINIDASIVIEESPIDSGERYIRRNQGHVFLNKNRPPEFKVKVTNKEYRCLLAWHIASYTYSQAEKIPYSIGAEGDVYDGTYRGKGIWEKWFNEDSIYKNETVNLRFLWKDNKGEPAEFELNELLKEKQRRYRIYYERWGRGEAARRASYDDETRAINDTERNNRLLGLPVTSNNNRRPFQAGKFNIRQYVPVINGSVDLRLWRPLTTEKLYLMNDADIFYFEGNTLTVEKVVLDMMSRMLNPQSQEDFGITRANAVRFALVDRLPTRQDGVQGKGVFNNTINNIKRNIKETIILEPYGELAGKTI